MRPANQWEYRLEHADEVGEATVAWLNSLGAEGWELVTMLPKAEGVRFVFKRLCRPATHATG